MKNKIIALFLCLALINIVVIQPKQAQAIAGVDDAVMLAYIATAAVAAGAVGTYVLNSDGTYSGTLHDFANTCLLNMSQTMKDGLRIALGGAYSYGYMKVKEVNGLWDYLHSIFLSSGSIVPSSIGPIDPALFLEPGSSLEFSNYGYGVNFITLYSGLYHNPIIEWSIDHVDGTIITGITYNWDNGDWSKLTESQKQGFEVWVLSLIIGKTWFPYMKGTVYVCPQDSTGVYPTSVPNVYPNVQVNDGTLERPLAIPKTPTDLNNWDGTTAIPTTNTGSVALPANPTLEQMKLADTATDLTSAPATTSDWVGTIGKAITTVFVGTGDLTINWEPLKMSGALFTTRFPFSIPWDIQNAITGLGTGSASAPKWTFTIPASPWTPSWSFVVDLSIFDSIIPALRAGELFLFTMGLAMATRRILGGAS